MKYIHENITVLNVRKFEITLICLNEKVEMNFEFAFW